jgi:AcrR family transcriptional regulator
MPPRDDQEYEQRRQQIITGALQAFSSKGFDRASNRDIAEAAKIGSPGLIYHYFKDKEDLLYQVLLERMPLLQALDIASGLLDLPPQELLPRIADLLDSVLSSEATVAILRIVLAEAIRNPRVAQMVNEIGPGRALRMFSGYLEQQMAAGRLRRMDTGIAARLFVGPILAYMMTRFIFQQEDVQTISPGAMVRGTAEAFLRALAPEP